MNPQKYKAIVGTQQLLKGGKAYNIRKVVVHEKYDEENIKNDISLIFLEKEIQFSENVDAVELNNEPVAPGEKLLLTGWGTTSVSNNISGRYHVHVKTLFIKFHIIILLLSHHRRSDFNYIYGEELL